MTLTLFCGPSTYQQTVRSNPSASSLSVDTSRATTAAAVWQVDESGGGEGGGGTTYEVDYDDDGDDTDNNSNNNNGRGPTSLYLAIEAQAWAPIIQFCNTGTWDSGWFWTAQKDPQSPAIQAQTWVTRFEPPPVLADDEANRRHNNSNNMATLRLDPPRKLRSPPSPPVIRWSHLPLHAAILFGAPLTVLQALIPLYPASIRCTDDQHSLPLHLALSVGASDEICLYLAQLFPPALWTKNQQGHWPCQVPVPSPKVPRQELLQLCVTAHAVENIAPRKDDEDLVLMHYQDQVIELKGQKEQLQTQVQSLQDQHQQSLAHQHALQERIHQLETELVTRQTAANATSPTNTANISTTTTNPPAFPYTPPPEQQQTLQPKKQVTDSSFFPLELPLEQLQRPAEPRQYQQQHQPQPPIAARVRAGGGLYRETRDAMESGRSVDRGGWTDHRGQQPSPSRGEHYYLPRLPPPSPGISQQEYHRRRPPQQPPAALASLSHAGASITPSLLDVETSPPHHHHHHRHQQQRRHRHQHQQDQEDDEDATDDRVSVDRRRPPSRSSQSRSQRSDKYHPHPHQQQHSHHHRTQKEDRQQHHEPYLEQAGRRIR